MAELNNIFLGKDFMTFKDVKYYNTFFIIRKHPGAEEEFLLLKMYENLAGIGNIENANEIIMPKNEL